MDIETVPIDSINPAKYNPRKDLKPGDTEYEKLRKSINEFGLVEPLIMNKRGNVLVGGHQRLKILKEQGLSEVEVSVVDLTESKEKALNIALNKISGEWDLPALKDLLLELDTGEFDIEITGFDDTEIEDLMTQLHVPEKGLTDDDDVPEPAESVCKPGDLWKLGNHRLLCGDATVITHVERLMAGEKADMVFTAPPYGVNYEGGTKKWEKIKGDTKGFEIFYESIGTALLYVKEEGSLYICYAGMHSQEVFTTLKNNGITLKNMIIWAKNNAQFGMLGANYHQKHEPILFGCKGEKYHWYGPKNEVTVWEIDRANKNEYHPTQKPVALSERAIGNSSQVNNIVLDLFGGSGSTLIACEKLGRRCYMMEIDPHYCDVIINRWQNFTGKQAELVG